MDGRPLVNDEFWGELIAKSSGKESDFKIRNELQLTLSCLAGFREIELTLVTVNLFVSPNGELNELLIMPDAIAYDGSERPIPLSNEELQNMIVLYLKWLLESGVNTQVGDSYLGLNPNAQLFVDDDYKAYTVQNRGNKTLSPNKMNKHLDSLIKKTALWDKGIRRKSFIRTYIIQAYKSGMSATDLILITGLGSETIEKVLVMDIGQYSPIYDWFVKRKDQKVKRLKSLKIRRKFQV